MMTGSTIPQCSVSALAAAVLATAASAGAVLENPSFETVGPLGPTTTFTGITGAPSAAASWNVWNNSPGTITSELVPSTLPGGGAMMLHVNTDTGASGIGQKFLPFDTGPGCSVSSAWIFVVSGQVTVATGNGGFIPQPYVLTTTTGQWELVTANNSACPTNNYIIYSNPQSAAGAEFYVDLASFEAIPCSSDLNGDRVVNGVDLALLLGAWGSCIGCCPADFDSSGAVNGFDLAVLLAAWGPVQR